VLPKFARLPNEKYSYRIDQFPFGIIFIDEWNNVIESVSKLTVPISPYLTAASGSFAVACFAIYEAKGPRI